MRRAPLVLFYALHPSLIPIALMLLMGFQFWRGRKAGGVVVPHPRGGAPEEQPARSPAYPDLLVRELGVGLAVIAVVLVLSLFFDAPLGEAANPGMSPNPAKAPWYFLGFQELQLHLHPVVAVVLLPLLMIGALIAIPFLKYETELSGPWFLTRKGLLSVVIGTLCTVVAVPALLVADDLWFRQATGAPSSIGRGLLPPGGLIGAVPARRILVVKAFSLSKAEVVQALFAFLFTAVAMATVVGVWFRGAGMALIWPFMVE